jgi:hypothetical protein
MTKREFIKRLHLASPEFKRDLEGIEIDPWLMFQRMIKGAIVNLGDKAEVNFPINDLVGAASGTTASAQFGANMRCAAGEMLFSKAAVVLPIYHETNRDDIDWTLVERLKNEFYGQSYRPKDSKYDKIIKIFRLGHTRKKLKAWTWKDIGASVGLAPSATESIYDRAYEFVYGKRPKKRAADRDRSPRERTTKTGTPEACISAFDPECVFR